MQPIHAELSVLVAQLGLDHIWDVRCLLSPLFCTGLGDNCNVVTSSQFISGTWSWRIPSLIQGLPSIAQVFLVLLAPESPRWLVSKGRDAEAIATLAYYHADGNE